MKSQGPLKEVRDDKQAQANAIWAVQSISNLINLGSSYPPPLL